MYQDGGMYDNIGDLQGAVNNAYDVANYKDDTPWWNKSVAANLAGPVGQGVGAALNQLPPVASAIGGGSVLGHGIGNIYFEIDN